ncbi:hypothetical protein [Stenotrophomonas maltophilia]|uniref:hypothetical protein n=1 Tax=Stenotrophomonas maltophilia TaxID=40324 RepID=UPI001EFA072F|nr:hypothetical protein [Stenotrophomonas maltophilia]
MTKPLRSVTKDNAGEFDQVAGGGDPPDDGAMRDRLTKLEALLPTLATKSDLSELKIDLEKGHKENRAWMLATVIALFLGTLAVGNFLAAGLKDSAKPQARQELNQPQPIIIQLPAQQPTVWSAPPAAPPESVLPAQPTAKPRP